MFSPNKLSEVVLGITSPLYFKEIKFDEKKQWLNIYIDFNKGSEFYYEDKSQLIKRLSKHMIH